ncbi:MAG: hypothetical protein V4582_23825 [Pseudomonadota bacterium]
MNDWSPRTIRGALFFGGGICAIQGQPFLTQELHKFSAFWAAVSQAGLSLVGLVCVIVGGYYLATRYKK